MEGKSNQQNDDAEGTQLRSSYPQVRIVRAHRELNGRRGGGHYERHGVKRGNSDFTFTVLSLCGGHFRALDHFATVVSFNGRSRCASGHRRPLMLILVGMGGRVVFVRVTAIAVMMVVPVMRLRENVSVQR